MLARLRAGQPPVGAGTDEAGNPLVKASKRPEPDACLALLDAGADPLDRAEFYRPGRVDWDIAAPTLAKGAKAAIQKRDALATLNAGDTTAGPAAPVVPSTGQPAATPAPACPKTSARVGGSGPMPPPAATTPAAGPSAALLAA